MSFIVLPVGDEVVIIWQKTLREILEVDVMAQPKASVLKAHVRKDGPEMENKAGAVASPMLAPCFGRRWRSRRSGQAATRQVTWTMTSK